VQGFGRAHEEWEKNVAVWGAFVWMNLGMTAHPFYLCSPAEKRQEEKAKAEAEAGAGSDTAGGAAAATTTTTTTRAPTEDAGSGMDELHGSGPGPGGGGGGPASAAAGSKDMPPQHGHPPQKKYRMTERMKVILWQLVSLSNECCRLENEKKCVIVSRLFVAFVWVIDDGALQYVRRVDGVGQ
jgi:hypothetical protein